MRMLVVRSSGGGMLGAESASPLSVRRSAPRWCSIVQSQVSQPCLSELPELPLLQVERLVWLW